MLIQAGVSDLGHGSWRIRAQLHQVKGGTQPADHLPRGDGTDLSVGQPVDGSLEESVLLDVLGVLVVGHLDGQWQSVPAPDLVGKPDLTSHGIEGVFLPAISAEQAAVDCLLGTAGEGQGNGLQDVGVGGQVDGFVPPVLGVQGVGHQEHDPVHKNLGPHDDSHVANIHGANV